MKNLLMRLAAVIILVLGLLIVVPTTAFALSFQGHVWGSAGAANINQAAPTAFGWWGPSIQTGLVLDLSEFWKLTADVQGSYHLQRTIEEDEIIGPHPVLSAALGARYAFDVFTYIPYLGLSAVVHPIGPPSERLPGGETLAIRATVGVDYRHNRRISFGGAAELSTPMTQPADFPLYSSIRAHVAFHFRRF